MSSEDRGNFTSSFLIWMPLIYFFLALLLWLEFPVPCWTGMVNESEHLYLVADLRRKTFSLSPLSMITEDLSYSGFIMLRYIPSVTTSFTSVLCTSQASRICQVLEVLSDRQDTSQSLGQPPEKLECWMHSPTLSFPREKLGFGGFHLFAEGWVTRVCACSSKLVLFSAAPDIWPFPVSAQIQARRK